MDEFIARANIRHYHELLLSEIAPDLRKSVQNLLVEEEDRLGNDLELLADIEKHLVEGERRIVTQRERIRTMKRDGHKGVETAQAFLDGMTESQTIVASYHRHIVDRIGRNGLMDSSAPPAGRPR